MGDMRRKSEMHRCEVCQTWLKNHPAVIAMHEQGAGHKAAVAKSLHDMRVKADREKEEAASTKKAVAEIDKAAAAQYECDRAAAEAARKALGSWENDESGHLYNATLRYYYNKDNGMYYGGDPPAWTTTPAIPADARFERLTATGTPAMAAAAAAGPSKAATAASSIQQQPVGKRIEKSAHPLSGIGGYRMPAQGTVGGARGVGVVVGGVSKVSSGSAATTKAKSTGAAGKTTSGKPMSQEEKEAIAKREAARARVAARNAAQFGM